MGRLPPDEIRRLADDGFDTAVRLPFDPEFARRRGFTEEGWIDDVRRSLNEDLSDQILLLLGTFSEVVVDYRLDGAEPATIRPQLSADRVPDVSGACGELVQIERTGAAATHWRIDRRVITGEKDLAGDITVGLRYEPTGEAAAMVSRGRRDEVVTVPSVLPDEDPVGPAVPASRLLPGRRVSQGFPWRCKAEQRAHLDRACRARA